MIFDDKKNLNNYWIGFDNLSTFCDQLYICELNIMGKRFDS